MPEGLIADKGAVFATLCLILALAIFGLYFREYVLFLLIPLAIIRLYILFTGAGDA